MRPLIHAVLIASAVVLPLASANTLPFAHSTVAQTQLFEEQDGLNAAVDQLDIYALWRSLLSKTPGLNFPLHSAADWRLHAIDVNDDQRPDLVAHSPQLGQMRIGLRRNHDFEWPQDLQALSQPGQNFVMDDFDGDDYLDFAVHHPDSQQLKLLPGEGGQSLHPNWLALSEPSQQLFGSVKGEQAAGLVGYSPESGELWWAENRGDRFEKRVLLQVSAHAPLSVVSGQFLDRGQRTAWVVSDPSEQQAWLVWLDGDQAVQKRTLGHVANLNRYAMTSGQFIAGGNEELALLEQHTGKLKLGTFSDNGELEFGDQYQLSAERPWRLLAADFDQAQGDDLLAYDADAGEYKLLLNAPNEPAPIAPQARWLSNGAAVLRKLWFF